MPSFAGKLSGAEIDDVLAYLRTRQVSAAPGASGNP